MKRNIVITGVSRGIGQSCLKLLVNAGYHIIGIVRNSESFKNSTESVSIYECDLLDFSAREEVCRKILNEHKKIYGIVNNAGQFLEEGFMNTSIKDLQQVFSINFEAPFHLTQLLLPGLVRQKEGVIINISSVNAVHEFSGTSAYSASKAALNSLTRSLSKELFSLNIRTNTISPGLVDTDIHTGYDLSQKKDLLHHARIKRFAEPTEIADAIEFLLSEKASYCNGMNLHINSGMFCPT